MSGSNRNILFWIATGFAGLALILVIVNSLYAHFDQSLRAEVAQRQQFIEQSVQLSRLNQELINALAAAAVRNDQAIHDLLTSVGITVTQNPTPAASSSAPPSGSAQPVPHR